MASTLTGQLAQIRQKSTNPLNLKQKKREHSQSLLFAHRVALQQDFKSIFAICRRGFDELCRLDERFERFSRSLFSDESLTQDRTQLEGTIERRTFESIESFFVLVNSRVRTECALQSIEWLIRRFRANINNAHTLLLIFLPHSDGPHFEDLLGILEPDALPKFLGPHMKAPHFPSHHIIEQGMANDRQLLTRYTKFVLRCCSLNTTSHAQISYWSSTFSGAIAILYDACRSSNRHRQAQNERDLTLFLLSLMNKILRMDSSSQFVMAKSQVLSVFLAHATLELPLLNALAEGIIAHWSPPDSAGLLCLAVLSAKMEAVALPITVVQFLLNLDGLVEKLCLLDEKNDLRTFVISLILGIVRQGESSHDVASRLTLNRLFHSRLSHHLSALSTRMRAQNLLPMFSGSVEQVGSVLNFLAEAREGMPGETFNIEPAPSSPLPKGAPIKHAESMPQYDFDAMSSSIPASIPSEASFLKGANSLIFHTLADMFRKTSTTSRLTHQFTLLPVLEQSLGTVKPTFLSFFARLWCSGLATHVRSASLGVVTNYLRAGISTDPQFLIPYMLHALLEPSLPIQKHAATLAVELHQFYVNQNDKNKPFNLPVLGKRNLYEIQPESPAVKWLSLEDAGSFLKLCVLPLIQEDAWAPDHALSIIVEGLGTVHRPAATMPALPHLRSSSRHAVIETLCGHINQTPLLAVKTKLLHIVTGVRKAGNQVTQLLSSLLGEISQMDDLTLDITCRQESIQPIEFLDAVTKIVRPKDYDNVMFLKSKIQKTLLTTSSRIVRDSFLTRLKHVYRSLHPDWQIEIVFSFLQPLSFETVQASQIASVRSTLSSLAISSHCLAKILQKVLAQPPNLEAEVPANKRRRLGSSGMHAFSAEAMHEAEMRILIVLLEATDKIGLEYDTSLLNLLFQILADLQIRSLVSTGGKSYLDSLLLDRMLTIIKACEEDSSGHLKAVSLNTEAVIHCIQGTTDLGSRNSGLLLLSEISHAAPERVLHSIISILTSPHAQRNGDEDDYTSRVVLQTLGSVLPPLFESIKLRRRNSLSEISNLLAGFAGAFNHLPVKIRQEIYRHLLAHAGEDSYLYVFLVLLVTAHPKSKKVSHFAIDMIAQYPVVTQVETIDRYLELVLDLCGPKISRSAEILPATSLQEGRTKAVQLLAFLQAFLSSESASECINYWRASDPPSLGMQSSRVERIVNTIITLLHIPGFPQSDSSLLRQPLHLLLDLLPTSSLMLILESLLRQARHADQMQILHTLQGRLETHRDTISSITPYLRLLNHLKTLLSEELDASLTVAVLKCMESIVSYFGRTDAEAILACSRLVSGPRYLASSSLEVRGRSLLCISAMITTGGQHLLPVLPSILDACLDVLQDSMSMRDTYLQYAAHTCLRSILAHGVIGFSGPRLDRLVVLSSLSASIQLGREMKILRRELWGLIAYHIDAEACLSTLQRTWQPVVSNGFLAVEEYMSLLENVDQRFEKTMTPRVQEQLEGVLIQILGLRQCIKGAAGAQTFTDTQLDSIETQAIDLTMSLVYKLNEKTFRPFFQRLLEWATITSSKMIPQLLNLRRSTLYNFLQVFFRSLKSVAAPYAAYVLPDINAMLLELRPTDSESRMLWQRIIRTLRKILQHDQDKFFQDPAYFAPTLSMLSSLLESIEVDLCQDEVIPAMVELASAVDSSARRNEINTALLQRMHSLKAPVRLNAVQCQRALVDQLGHDWLAMLPEMLPLISELQEDDDEKVEHETLRWMAKIEATIGASLAPMLR